MKDPTSAVGLEASPPKAWVTYAFLSLGLVMVHAALIHFRYPEVMGGRLVDPDSYSRLIRVAQLHESGGWFDSMIPRMNAPFGMELHWTRPLDIILLVSSWLLSPFIGFQRALLLSGIFLSPILHIVSCLAAAWAVVPIVGPRGRPMMILVLVAQPILISYAVAGRADHHILLVLAYVLSLGCFFRMITQPDLRWPAFAGGAVAGLGLWVSIEFLLPLMTLYACPDCLVVGRVPQDRPEVFPIFPPDWRLWWRLLSWLNIPHPCFFSPEYDRISAPHMLLAILALGFWKLVLLAEGRASHPGISPVQGSLPLLGCCGSAWEPSPLPIRGSSPTP